VSILLFISMFKLKYNKTTNNIILNNGSFPLLNYNFNKLNFSSKIKDIEERKLYIKNKTEYYLYKRIKYLLRFNITYNEKNLTTFQDKINYLIIHESPSYKSFLADKIIVRQYVKKVIGKDICVPIIKIYNNVKDIKFAELPDKFVLKLNHGSGMNIICDNKYKLNISDSIRKLKIWKNVNFGSIGQEFQYLYIKRKIFAEKFLGNNITDYKFFCFNGEPKFIRVRIILNGTNITKIHNHYDINWKLTDLESGLKGYKRDPNIKIEKPKNLNKMIKYAKLLSQEFVFIRVDFYEVNNTVYLGELTFSPTNSFVLFKNIEQSLKIAKLMDLAKIKKYLFNK